MLSVFQPTVAWAKCLLRFPKMEGLSRVSDILHPSRTLRNSIRRPQSRNQTIELNVISGNAQNGDQVTNGESGCLPCCSKICASSCRPQSENQPTEQNNDPDNPQNGDQRTNEESGCLPCCSKICASRCRPQSENQPTEQNSDPPQNGDQRTNEESACLPCCRILLGSTRRVPPPNQTSPQPEVQGPRINEGASAPRDEEQPSSSSGSNVENPSLSLRGPTDEIYNDPLSEETPPASPPRRTDSECSCRFGVLRRLKQKSSSVEWCSNPKIWAYIAFIVLIYVASMIFGPVIFPAAPLKLVYSMPNILLALFALMFLMLCISNQKEKERAEKLKEDSHEPRYPCKPPSPFGMQTPSPTSLPEAEASAEGATAGASAEGATAGASAEGATAGASAEGATAGASAEGATAGTSPDNASAPTVVVPLQTAKIPEGQSGETSTPDSLSRFKCCQS